MVQYKGDEVISDVGLSEAQIELKYRMLKEKTKLLNNLAWWTVGCFAVTYFTLTLADIFAYIIIGFLVFETLIFLIIYNIMNKKLNESITRQVLELCETV